MGARESGTDMRPGWRSDGGGGRYEEMVTDRNHSLKHGREAEACLGHQVRLQLSSCPAP